MKKSLLDLTTESNYIITGGPAGVWFCISKPTGEIHPALWVGSHPTEAEDNRASGQAHGVSGRTKIGPVGEGKQHPKVRGGRSSSIGWEEGVQWGHLGTSLRSLAGHQAHWRQWREGTRWQGPNTWLGDGEDQVGERFRPGCASP